MKTVKSKIHGFTKTPSGAFLVVNSAQLSLWINSRSDATTYKALIGTEATFEVVTRNGKTYHNLLLTDIPEDALKELDEEEASLSTSLEQEADMPF